MVRIVMSPSQEGAPDVGGKKCENVAKSGLKCINCGVLSHVSCLKHLKNIICINESSFKCCGMALSEVGINEDYHSDDVDLSFGNAIDNSNKLIENQNFTLKALCNQIDLLKRSTNNNHFNQLSAQQVTSQGEKCNLVDIPESIAAIHQADSEAKCREIIQMGSKENASGRSEGFTLVSKRKENKLRNIPAIVGHLDLPCGSSIKYAPKMSFSHVYKMHPGTITEDLFSF
ncbi:hypothetical protein JTB14_024515 [Gonioctena quinquepunctata]|nr:hypothetical protein JTB14_024515 [Gonioctena quinquepunctata]